MSYSTPTANRRLKQTQSCCNKWCTCACLRCLRHRCTRRTRRQSSRLHLRRRVDLLRLSRSRARRVLASEKTQVRRGEVWDLPASRGLGKHCVCLSQVRQIEHICTRMRSTYVAIVRASKVWFAFQAVDRPNVCAFGLIDKTDHISNSERVVHPRLPQQFLTANMWTFLFKIPLTAYGWSALHMSSPPGQ